MENSTLMLNLLAGGMLVLTFLMQAKSRLYSLLRLFAWQSAALALYALIAATQHHEWPLIVTAILTVALKCLYLPRLLARSAKSSHAMLRLPSYLRPATQLFGGALLIVIGFAVTRSLVSMDAAGYLIAAVSVSMVLLGLFMLVVRQGLYAQIVGFLVMENGIFTFGLALTGGMPILVELGVFFDVIVGVMLMAMLSAKVQEVYGAAATDRLTELVD